MNKRIIALILALGLALPLAAAAEPSLKLVPAQWYAEDGEYTLTQNPHPVTVTQEWLDAQGVTPEQAQSMGVGLASESITAPLPNAPALLAAARVVSVLPDGETLLLDMDGALLLFDGENIRAVGVDLTRCKRSESLGFTMAIDLHDAIRSTGIGRAGYLWSPDGRYALVANATVTFLNWKNPFGMTLLDARDGMLYMAEPGGERIMAIGTIIQQACFDSESGLLYCVVSADEETQLRSYNPLNAEWKSLCALDNVMACEGMGWDAKGDLQFLMNKSEDTYLTTYSVETGTTARELLSDIGYPVYFAVTPAFTLLTSYDKAEDRFRQYSLADGDIRLIAVSEESGAASARLAPAGEEQAESLAVTHAALSSDGKYAMLVCAGDEKTFSAYVMDTSTLALTSVDISVIADEIAEKGAGFQYGNARWRPGLCFTGGDRYILLPFLDGSTMLCELTQTGAQ